MDEEQLELEAEARAAIAADINSMIKNKLRRGPTYPMKTQVALANLFSEARTACRFVNISFPKWVAKNIKGLTYEEAQRLAAAGDSKDPEAYILRRREENRKRNIRYREYVKSSYRDEKFVKDRFDALDIDSKIMFLKSIVEDFPPFDGHNEESATLLGEIERRLND